MAFMCLRKAQWTHEQPLLLLVILHYIVEINPITSCNVHHATYIIVDVLASCMFDTCIQVGLYTSH